MKNITKTQIDELTNDQLKQMVMCTNDGQGDTSVDSVHELRGWHADKDGNSLDTGKPLSNSDLLDILWSDTNGNMTTFIWIENNSFEKISFNF